MLPISKEYSSVRRRRRDTTIPIPDYRVSKIELGSFTHHVSHTTHGVDQSQLAIRFQLLAQITDVHFQHIAFAAEVIAPYAVKDHLTRQDLLGVTQKELQQFRFLGCQRHEAIAARSLARTGIKSKIGEFQNGDTLRLWTRQKGAYTLRQFV